MRLEYLKLKHLFASKRDQENLWCSFTEIKVASGLTKVVSKIQENFQNTEKAIFKSFVWFHLDFLLWDAIVQSIET